MRRKLYWTRTFALLSCMLFGVAHQGVLPAGAGLPELSSPAPNEMLPPLLGVLQRGFEQPPAPWAAGHRGVDIEAVASTDLLAPIGGKLSTGVTVGNRYATIEPNDASIRVTLSYLDQVLVSNGAAVKAGDLVAKSGLGHPEAGERPHHVHLSVRLPDLTDPSGWRYVDPMPYMRRYLRRIRASVVSLPPR